MCIAIGKPIGVDIPDESILRNCWENNDDGAGFAFNFNGKVFIKKGFMTYESFIDALNSANNKYDLKKKGMLIHFRIATHGSRDSSMTHPFPINYDDGALKKIEYISDYAVIHNGIITLTSYDAKKTEGLSDTAVFIKKYLTLIASNKNWFYNKQNVDLIEELIDSKMAILNKNGDIKMTSGFTEDNGVYYSNSSYEDNYNRYIGSNNKFLQDYYSEYYNDTYGNYNSYSSSFNKNVTVCHRIPLMRIRVGDTVECDSGSMYIKNEDDAVYYAGKPNKGRSAIYIAYFPDEDYVEDCQSCEEYFTDFEFIGYGNFYDRNMNVIPFTSDISVYSDQFIGDCTPENMR